MFIPYRVDVPFNHRPVVNSVVVAGSRRGMLEIPGVPGNGGDYWA